MERIGIAASKMAKGNLLLYNLYVLLISFLFSLLIFFLAGGAILLALLLIGEALRRFLPEIVKGHWMAVVQVCMLSLSAVVGIVTLFAISRNVKIKKD